jgi:hypothetical protein
MADAQRFLEVTTARHKAIERPLSCLTKQRRDVLKKPGSLENLVKIENQKNLELIPVSKKSRKKHGYNTYFMWLSKHRQPKYSRFNWDANGTLSVEIGMIQRITPTKNH